MFRKGSSWSFQNEHFQFFLILWHLMEDPICTDFILEWDSAETNSHEHPHLSENSPAFSTYHIYISKSNKNTSYTFIGTFFSWLELYRVSSFSFSVTNYEAQLVASYIFNKMCLNLWRDLKGCDSNFEVKCSNHKSCYNWNNYHANKQYVLRKFFKTIITI